MVPDDVKSENFYNHLKDEKSPYLIQHAQNPVDWYPWGDKAFQKAKAEKKPIFLSIGYSTCHWCHVMAHESFEDPEIGELLNQNFVSIKVDREERPDIDSIYMTVCQMMTGAGGWPLTILMTPDKEPFFAGTYFPRESHLGGIGLKDLILNVRDLWMRDEKEVLKSAGDIMKALKTISTTPKGAELDQNILDKTYQELSKNFDPIYGGFGDFQKFPTPHNLFFLLRYWKRTREKNALEMVEKTLNSMANGGIYDHLGFGFHRYSVDKRWFAPHFEKMLYDQALITTAYLEAFQATGNERYGLIAEEILEYVLRDMKSPEGGFYSAEDADSEGFEGKFYLWTRKEIFQVLDRDDAELISRLYNITEEGNFQDEATGKSTGANILFLEDSVDYSKITPHEGENFHKTLFEGIDPKKALSEELDISLDELDEKIERSKLKLFKAREKRVHPHKDDKILTDWNGLIIAALAKAAQIFGEKKYVDAAEGAANFICNKMFQDGRLMHRYREGEAGITANLDDYAFMIWGLLELYETVFDAEYLKMALSLNKTLLKHFWDEKEGGFFFTPDYGEKLLLREKKSSDSAIPSGNSVQILNLLRISLITGDTELKEKSINSEMAFSQGVHRIPAGHTQLLCAVDFKLGPTYEVVLVGDPQGKDTKDMLEAIRKPFLPHKVLILKPEGADDLIEINESLRFRESVDGKITAYICVDGTCKLPTTDTKEVLNLLT